MKYRVHHLEVKEDTVQEQLQQFLNQLEGEVVAIVPYVTRLMQIYGATSRVSFLLIVEKTPTSSLPMFYEAGTEG